eukprot:360853-Chlamydomonas_euryale.AAC.5
MQRLSQPHCMQRQLHYDDWCVCGIRAALTERALDSCPAGRPGRTLFKTLRRWNPRSPNRRKYGSYCHSKSQGNNNNICVCNTVFVCPYARPHPASTQPPPPRQEHLHMSRMLQAASGLIRAYLIASCEDPHALQTCGLIRAYLIACGASAFVNVVCAVDFLGVQGTACCLALVTALFTRIAGHASFQVHACSPASSNNDS